MSHNKDNRPWSVEERIRHHQARGRTGMSVADWRLWTSPEVRLPAAEIARRSGMSLNQTKAWLIRDGKGPLYGLTEEKE